MCKQTKFLYRSVLNKNAFKKVSIVPSFYIHYKIMCNVNYEIPGNFNGTSYISEAEKKNTKTSDFCELINAWNRKMHPKSRWHSAVLRARTNTVSRLLYTYLF